MPLTDLRPYLDQPDVHELLAHAVGYPTPEKMARVLDSYRQAGTLALRGWYTHGVLVGCIGLERAARQVGVVRHIAVTPAARRQGVGRAMLEAAGRADRLRVLQAETDAGAVDFYRRCGFEVVSLGERYAGVERFQCVKRLDG